MTASLLAIGSVMPTNLLKQNDASRYAQDRCCDSQKHRRLLAAIYRRSGIDTRHTVLTEDISDAFFPMQDAGADASPTTAERMHEYARYAGALATEACGEALQRSSVVAAEITHLVTVSCTGFRAPGVDIEIIHQLGMSSSVARTSVGFMGCQGALNGMRIARAFVEADSTAVVLLCCVELCSLHFAYGWEPQRVVANSLFSDGAAAAVISATVPSSGARRWEILNQTSCVIPDSEDVMTWSIGDRGFEMTLSARVPTLIQTNLHSFLSSWLSTQSYEITDISTWAVHPGGPRVLDAVQASLSLSGEALSVSREILRTYGNVSSVTLLLVLDSLSPRAAPGPAVMLAFGPGLTIEAALLR